MSMNIIIFGFNRPMQLELLLRSLKKYFVEWKETSTTIIFKASSEEYAEGYELLSRSIHPEFSYSPEINFKRDVLEAIDDTNQFTMFLVDDIVFKTKFSILNDSIFGMLRNNLYMQAISLRLHKGIDHCYATNEETLPPGFVKTVNGEFLVWNWQAALGDWGYGFSLDGNIYNTNYIKEACKIASYSNPNTLEAFLNNPNFSFGIKPLYMCCYDGPSKLINVPSNKIQTVFNNRCENSYTIEELNKKFLAGEKISLINIENVTNNNTVHWPLDYKFEKRK